ncbi:MAG: helix-turn-helix domain-containing protein [Planctomycetota bacterium]
MQYRLETAPGIEELCQDLQLRIHHAACVAEGQPGARFCNRLPHARLFATLACTGASGGTCTIGERQLPLCPGQVVLVPPAQELHLHFAPGLRLMAFHLDCRFGAGFDLLADSSLQSLPVARRRLARWRTCLDADVDPVPAALTLQGELLLLLAGARLLDGARLAILRSAVRRYRPLFLLTEEQAPAAVDVRACAAAMGMGASTLSRAFHRDCGMTLRAFLQERTLHSALDLLRGGHDSSRAISRRLGFGSEQSFSRFVRRQTGLSPGRYRQRMRSHVLEQPCPEPPRLRQDHDQAPLSGCAGVAAWPGSGRPDDG